MTSHPRFRLPTLRAAKTLIQVRLLFGALDCLDLTDRWDV